MKSLLKIVTSKFKRQVIIYGLKGQMIFRGNNTVFRRNEEGVVVVDRV